MKTKNFSKSISFISTVALSLVILLFSCEKDDNGDENGNNQSNIQLTTAEVTEITSGTARSGGKITSDGGSVITERGVCYSNIDNPTINDPHTIDGSGTGSFESNITALLSNIDYYVRAYATNKNGTVYGNTLKFKTLQAIIEGTYYESGHYYRHIKVIESGNKINLYYIPDMPEEHVQFENRGKLTSDPSSGFVVTGEWNKFIFNSAGSITYWVVNQPDNNTILVRSSNDGYQEAYEAGANKTYIK